MKPLACWMLAALLAGACRTAPIDPPLVEITGVVGSSAVTPTAEVRAALVWVVYGDDSGDGYHLVAHEVEAEGLGDGTAAPAPFKLGITRLPPEEALRTYYAAFPTEPTDVREAAADLVVYEDRNGDQALDLITAGAQTGSPDRVLGKVKDMEVGYFDGTLPADLPAEVRGPGFHLLQFYEAEGGWTAIRRLPISTPIEVDLTGEPELEEVLCDSPAVPPCWWPCEGAQVTCHADGGLTYRTCEPLPAVCKPACVENTLPLPQPRPDSWPCP